MHEFVPIKISQECSSPNFPLVGESKRMLSRLRNPGIPGVRIPDVVLLSESRGAEIHKWFRRFWRSVSQRRLPRFPESMCKRSFTPSNVDSRCKGSSGQGMKGSYKEAHKTKKESPLCYIDGHELVHKRRFLSLRSLARTKKRKPRVEER